VLCGECSVFVWLIKCCWCCTNQAGSELAHANSVANNEVKMFPREHISEDKVLDDDLSNVSVEVLVSKHVMRFKCYFHLLI
jgi:hypothetical protein